MKNKNFYNSPPKILVIGSTGFIGLNLVIKLKKIGCVVTGISFKKLFNLNLNLEIDHFQININDTNKIIDIIKENNFDYILNISGYIDHSTFWEGGFNVINDHLMSQINLIKYLENIDIKRYIQIGTSHEYPKSETGQIENNLDFSKSSYSFAKSSMTNFLKMLHYTNGFPGVTIRFFLVFGPHQNIDRLVPYTIFNCLNDNEFDVSYGNQLRDFCYIDDVVDGILATIFEDKIDGEVINIASGKPIKVRQLVDHIQTKIGLGKPRYGKYKNHLAEDEILYANINKARKLLNWEPKTSLTEGLEKTISFFKIGLSDEE